MNLRFSVLIGLFLGALIANLHSESKSENLIECPGFEEEKNSMTERKYPLGLHWRERSKGGLCQEVGAAKGNDSEVALELHKDEGQGTNHRIVNQLGGVTLKAGVEYLLQFDFWSGEEFPARDCGVQVGISSTGGEGRPEWGTNDYIPGAFTVLNVNTIEEGSKWLTLRIRFTPDKDYENPFVLIMENWYHTGPYLLRFDNFRLTEAKP